LETNSESESPRPEHEQVCCWPHNEANLNDPQLKSIFRVVKSFSAGGWALGGSLGPSSLKWKGQTDVQLVGVTSISQTWLGSH